MGRKTRVLVCVLVCAWVSLPPPFTLKEGSCVSLCVRLCLSVRGSFPVSFTAKESSCLRVYIHVWGRLSRSLSGRELVSCVFMGVSHSKGNPASFVCVRHVKASLFLAHTLPPRHNAWLTPPSLLGHSWSTFQLEELNGEEGLACACVLVDLSLTHTLLSPGLCMGTPHSLLGLLWSVHISTGGAEWARNVVRFCASLSLSPRGDCAWLHHTACCVFME